MKINSEENTEFSGNKGQEDYSSDLSICRGVLGCTSNSAYSANKMLSECTMALDSSEDYSFLVCRSLQGQVADLLREDYRTSNGWALVSYHERGREAVTEHELQSRQLMMAAFTRYLLHAWLAADSRDQLRGINYKLDLLLTRVPSKQGECKITGRAVTSVNSAASKSTSATRESATKSERCKGVSDKCERYKRVSDECERCEGVSDECERYTGVSDECVRQRGVQQRMRALHQKQRRRQALPQRYQVRQQQSMAPDAPVGRRAAPTQRRVLSQVLELIHQAHPHQVRGADGVLVAKCANRGQRVSC